MAAQHFIGHSPYKSFWSKQRNPKSSTPRPPLSCRYPGNRTRGIIHTHPPKTKPTTAPKMSAADQLSVEQSDIEKLNDKDKSELRQFFSNEEQRARIQSRMS